MPASFLQATGLEPVGSDTAVTSSAIAITTGSYLFAHASHYTTGINVSAVIQTSGGNTFVKAGTTQGGDANQDNEIWYTPSPITGTTSATFQVRYTGSAGFRIIQVAEFSWGGITSVSYDVEATHALISGSAHTSNSLTPTQADSLLIGAWVAFDAPRSLSTGSATLIGPATGTTADDFALGYRLANSISTYTVSVIGPSTADRYSVILKAFKGVAAGGTVTAMPSTLPLLGVGR